VWRLEKNYYDTVIHLTRRGDFNRCRRQILVSDLNSNSIEAQ
jgi:hypothetical protein